MAQYLDLETSACLVWKTNIPYKDRPRNSSDFSLLGSEFRLEFFRTANSWELYQIYLVQVTEEESKVFSVTTMIQHPTEDSDLSLSRVETVNFSGSRVRICCIRTEGELSERFPWFHVLGRVRIICVFHGVPSSALRTRNEPNEYVQTSPHLDDHSCLESLSLDLRKLMDEGSNPDVQLKCGDCTLPAHRLILCARSEVFRAMLQTDMLEGREGAIEIPDMEPSVLELFVRYVYTGTLPDLTVDTASPLYEAGDKYRLEALMKRCGDFLAENLTPDNACRILTMADGHSDNNLKAAALSYVSSKKIPNEDEEWSELCVKRPKLGSEMLYHAYKGSF